MENKQGPNPHVDNFLPFDPIVIVRDVIRKWFLILVVTVCFGVGAFICTEMSYEPVYQSSATLAVSTKGSYSTVYSNLSSTSTLASEFTELLNSSVLKKMILEQLEMPHFDGEIQSESIGATNLLTIQVQASDPRTAFLVIRAIMDNHHIVTENVIGEITLEVLQQPTVSTDPVNSDNASGEAKKAALVAAAAMCVIASLQSYYRDTVRSQQEAEKKLDCWCLGEIPHERKNKTFADVRKKRKKSILITGSETGFQYVFAIGRLRQSVEQHMHGGKLLMITSVTEHEGKSTVAVNLALAMAKKYNKVLLIDCDLRRPACNQILGNPQPEYSIVDVLGGTASLNDAICIDKNSGLCTLCARHVAAQTAADLINSEKLLILLQYVRKKYDFVVIDLPPMSVTTDAECMMDHADASLLLVRQNMVTAGAVNCSISVLQRGKAKLLGCVLNDVHSTFLSSGKGYCGGYGRYGSHGKYGRYFASAQNKTVQ